MLWRALRHVADGFYIDVGAADPIEYSVTRIFYERDWSGINLEPNPSYFAALEKERPRDINLCLGAGRAAGQLMFYEMDGGGLSTFDPGIAAMHRAEGRVLAERPVETLPLADICRRYRPAGPIHFLKIDVEGSEGDVLAGADFAKFRPWIVLVEATLPGSQVDSYQAWEPLLIQHEYSFIWFDGLNRFYISDEMKTELERHFKVPPNVFDGFESTASLWFRAKQAEAGLADANARREAICRALEIAEQSLQTCQANLARTKRRAELSDTRLTHLRANLDRAEQRAQLSEAQVADLLASTSWRVTAPIRMFSRPLSRLARSTYGLVTRYASLAGDLSGKQIVRTLFHRSTRRLLQLPGGRRVSRLIYKVAPRPVEWLALRYRAYDQRDAMDFVSAGRGLSKYHRSVNLSEASIFQDLSEDEGRLYRQIDALGLTLKG